jgi:5-dehydro-2-deoxygluconokinase
VVIGAAFDLVTMGRVGVDIYPRQVGTGLADVESFGKFLGGSPTNVAVAAARYGRGSAVITKTGADPFGEFVRRALRGYGVDDRFVGTSHQLPTPVTFCEIFPPDDFPLYFYRFPKAPDMDIAVEELDLEAIRSARVFWVTVTGLSEEPSRSATLAALAARGRREITVLDLEVAEHTTVVHVETDLHGPNPPGSAWWDVPVSEVSELNSTRKAYETYTAIKQNQRHYL